VEQVINRIKQWLQGTPPQPKTYKFEVAEIGKGVVGHVVVTSNDEASARWGAIIATPPGLLVGPAIVVTETGDTVH